METIEFESLPLPEAVMKGIRDAGFKTCTPIQAITLPITLKGRDVAGQAQTGTGKTAAFLISAFTQLLRSNKESKHGKLIAPRSLIIAPTRELAIQIEKDAMVLGKHTGLKIVCVYGGVDYEKQKEKIQSGVDMLIATPGRFIDYYKQKFFSLKGVEVLIIDEADRMFDMGFISDIRYIFRHTTKYNERLTMLYSATLNHRVMELCYEHMNDPVPIKIEPNKIVVDEVEQILYHVGSDEKFKLLLGLMKQEKGEKVLIFVNTKVVAEGLEAQLIYNGYNSAQISGDLHQRKRTATLERFTSGDLQVLIATDVASRGLHVDDITHVINYDLPQDPEDYIHRIGRTARAGKKGDAISLACEDYVEALERIEEMLKDKIPVAWPDEALFLEEKAGTPKIRRRRPAGPPRNRDGTIRPPRNGGGRGGPPRRGGSGRGGPPNRGRSGGGRPPRRPSSSRKS